MDARMRGTSARSTPVPDHLRSAPEVVMVQAAMLHAFRQLRCRRSFALRRLWRAPRDTSRQLSWSRWLSRENRVVEVVLDRGAPLVRASGHGDRRPGDRAHHGALRGGPGLLHQLAANDVAERFGRFVYPAARSSRRTFEQLRVDCPADAADFTDAKIVTAAEWHECTSRDTGKSGKTSTRK